MFTRMLSIIFLFAAIISLSFANTPINHTTDRDINSSAINLISNDKKLKDMKITVTTENNVITIKGDINNQDNADLLIEVLQSIPGVKDVDVSGLTINKEQTPFADAVITAKIIGIIAQQRIFGDLSITKTNISVSTENGVVTLTGHAKSHEQAAKAVDLAESIKGVKKVNSEITVN